MVIFALGEIIVQKLPLDRKVDSWELTENRFVKNFNLGVDFTGEGRYNV